MYKKDFAISKKIRIIGGIWKGRKISTIISQKMRPTNERMRETLFNWLSTEIHGSFCLDCFSGSGILGIESVSRSASFALLIEKNRCYSKKTVENIKSLQSFKIKVLNTDSLLWLSKNRGILFDIVFIDPPFHLNLVKQTIFLLEKNNHLSKKSWIYIEQEKNNVHSIPDTWSVYREKNSKNVSYKLYLRSKERYL